MTQADVTSMRNATIFGAPIYETFVKASDLDVKIVAATMILLMTATTFITQRQLMVKNMPTGVDNPMAQQQKILLYVFPVMFAVFGINFPIGVLIYWLTTNVWTMGQQFWVIRRNPTPGSEAWDDLQQRKAAKARDARRAGARARCARSPSRGAHAAQAPVQEPAQGRSQGRLRGLGLGLRIP